MAVTQYIGSRYVPLLADPVEWSSTKEYEPLTIVTHEGNSYTSRQFVPKGMAITNESYWALTGNYNGQVEQYRRETAAMTGRMNALDANITGRMNALDTEVTNRLNATDGDVTNIENVLPISAFSANETVFDYVNKNAGNFKNANIICVTDSWGSEGAYNVTTCWMHMVCDWLGANYIDLHQGSTGFIYANNFLTRLTNWHNTHANMVDSIKYIFVCGSINDWESTHQQINLAINSFVNYAVSNFPNATVVLFMQPVPPQPYKISGAGGAANYNPWSRVIYGNDYYMGTHQTSQRCIYVMETAYALTKANGIPDTCMNADNIHPKQYGHNLIARAAYEALMGQHSTVTIPVNYLGIYYGPQNRSSLTQLNPTRKYGNMTISGNIATIEYGFVCDFSNVFDQYIWIDMPNFIPLTQLPVMISNIGTLHIQDTQGNAYLSSMISMGSSSFFSLPMNQENNSWVRSDRGMRNIGAGYAVLSGSFPLSTCALSY